MKSYDKLRKHIKKQRCHFADKGAYSQSYGFSNSHAQMWELDHKDGWALKSWCFWTVVWEKTLESPLDSKEIKPENSKENQPWILTGRTDAEAPILCSLDVQSQLIRKDPDAGEDWRQRKKGTAENKMVRQQHWLSGHESEQTLGDSGGQRSLACYSPWDCKEPDMTATEQQNSYKWFTKSVNFKSKELE